MSLEVQMVGDVRKFDAKILGPFSKRQTISLILAAILAIPLWMYIPLEWDNKLIIVLAFVGPIIVCGSIKIDGTNLEVFLLRYIYLYYLTPPKRKYKTTCSYKVLYNKRYKRKPKSKDGKVIYSDNPEYKIYR